MAREAYRSLYGDLTKLKDDSLLKDPAGGSGDDTEMFQLLLACSDWVDRYCNRHFYSRTQSLKFDGPGGDRPLGLSQERLLIPDLVALTSLKADENQDGTFEVTWASTDYWLEPYNAEPTQPWGEPYTAIRARSKGTKQKFLEGEQIYEVTGRWGYREHKEDSGSDVNEGATFSATDTTLTVTLGTDFAIGQTIMVDNEQLLVTNISGNNLTVVRGLNGTTAASHANGGDIFILRWPAAVERACLMQAARIYKRAPEFQPFYVDADLDTDVRLLLEAYRRVQV
jgi:hypothetical protein